MTLLPGRLRGARLRRPTRIRVRENWYRDVWLLIITGVVALAVSQAQEGSRQAARAGRQAKQAAVEIQAQRVETIRTSCKAQNLRHVRTVRELLQIAAIIERKQPSKAREVRSSIGYNILLIDQLAPLQDCAAVVRAATSAPPRASLPPIRQAYPPILPRRH